MKQELYKEAKSIADKLHIVNVVLKKMEDFQHYKNNIEHDITGHSGVLMQSTIDNIHSIIMNDLRNQIQDLTEKFEQL